MSSVQVTSEGQEMSAGAAGVGMGLEVVVIPVSEVDRDCQLISRGIPTLTDTSLACRSDTRTQHLPRLSGTPGTLEITSDPGSWKRPGNGPPVPADSLGSQRRTGAVSDPAGVTRRELVKRACAALRHGTVLTRDLRGGSA